MGDTFKDDIKQYTVKAELFQEPRNTSNR